jgi:hypothetical protein
LVFIRTDQFDFFTGLIGWFQDWILLSDWLFSDLDGFGFFRIRIFLFPGQGLGLNSVGFSGFQTSRFFRFGFGFSGYSVVFSGIG